MADPRDNIGRDGRYYGPPPDEPSPNRPPQIRRKPRKLTPQDAVQQYWDRLDSKYPGKVFTVLPNNPYARKKAAKIPHGTVHGQRAAKSYEEARAECIKDVDRIIKECRRLNQKYRDPHFDIEWDLKSKNRNCLDGLSVIGDSMKPKGVKRVTDIFEKPEFYINGPTAGDVRQGRDGDCYLMAALCGLGNKEGLIDKVCVKHDWKVGVYGFVFFRDGEWQYTIIDDKLYLRAPDYDEAQDERVVWDDINRADSAEEYRKAHQTGSRALYFAQCSEENETWLPLLEKAYAKAHGDFASIDGGFTGEAIEDLTGGVTTEIYSTDILDREDFWNNELLQVGKTFLFGCATGFYSDWLDTSGQPREREGIAENHAYSIMDAKEVGGHRLLKLRNPWGKKEWTGKWSDGDSVWNASWMDLLDHKFGNDGIFWISFEDLLKKYQIIDRTRIFGPEWHVTQCWTSLSVSWSAEYHSTKFSLTLEKKAQVVIVLAQLDETYFRGLEGAYAFDLQFRLESDNKEDENDYIVRSNANYAMARSVSTDIELDAGTYSVLMRITATRHVDRDHLEDVLPMYAATRREKLIQMGLSYDLAHAKGVIVETEAEQKERKERRKAQKVKDRQKLKMKLNKEAEKEWTKRKDRHEKQKARNARIKQWRERKRSADERVDNSKVNGVNPGLSAAGGEISNENGVPNEHKPQDTREQSGELQDDPSGSMQGQTAKVEDLAFRKKGDRVDEIIHNMGGFDTPSTTKAPEELSAEKVVEPLEDVILTADQESKANLLTEVQADSHQAPNKLEPGIAGTGTNEDVKPFKAEGAEATTNVKMATSQPSPSIASKATVSTMESAKGNWAGTAGNPSRYPLRSDTFNTTAAMIGADMRAGASEDDLENGDQRPADNESVQEDNANSDDDGDSFPPFDWDSQLDMPSESSDHESSPTSSARGRPRPRRRRRRPGPDNGPPPDMKDGRERTDDAGEGPDEPWNAVCVVGLRVYSTLSGEKVRLKVVRPLDDDNSDGENNDEGDRREIDQEDEAKGTKLDPDDISKGAVAVVPQSTGVEVEEGGKAEIKKGEHMRLGRKLGRRPR
ncbi:hypothetical protein EDD37DRAFT_23259 [Exophiala viscosa]|uniref:uncharacterized protein n=1 Tax=Exophiala viscosa TaxID=2486360 RepID=UPI0021944496|nr:hypothetical protein EDD37DRAFT_23259 [Exophiala viscosa]